MNCTAIKKMFGGSVKISFALICCLSSIIFVQAIKNWPSHLPRCYRDDPDVNNCLIELSEKLRPYVKKGIPELGIPSISSIVIPEVSIQNEGASASYKAVFINPTFTGFDSYKFRKIDVDFKNFSVDAVFDADLVEFFSNIVAKGNLLSIPFQGNATVRIESQNGTVSLKLKATVITKKGVNYLEFDKSEVSFDFGEIVDLRYDVFLTKNELIAKIIDNILAENDRILLEELRPSAEEAAAAFLTMVLNKYASRTPYHELFPIHKN